MSNNGEWQIKKKKRSIKAKPTQKKQQQKQRSKQKSQQPAKPKQEQQEKQQEQEPNQKQKQEQEQEQEQEQKQEPKQKQQEQEKQKEQSKQQEQEPNQKQKPKQKQKQKQKQKPKQKQRQKSKQKQNQKPKKKQQKNQTNNFQIEIEKQKQQNNNKNKKKQKKKLQNKNLKQQTLKELSETKFTVKSFHLILKKIKKENPNELEMQYNELLSYFEETLSVVSDYSAHTQDFFQLLEFPCNNHKIEDFQKLIEFLQLFPKMKLLAFLLDLVDQIPPFASQRSSVWYGRMFMIKAILLAEPLLIVEPKNRTKIKTKIFADLKNNEELFDNYLWIISHGIFSKPIETFNIWLYEYCPLLHEQECTAERAHQIYDFLDSLLFYGTNYETLQSSSEIRIDPKVFKDYLFLYGSLIQSFGVWFREGYNIENDKGNVVDDDNSGDEDNTEDEDEDDQKKEEEKTKGKHDVIITEEIEKETGKEKEKEKLKEKTKKNQKNSKMEERKPSHPPLFTKEVKKRMEKTFQLIEQLSIFSDLQSTPHLYFAELLEFACSTNDWLRNCSNRYLIESLVQDDYCFQVWKQIYPFFIPQSNNLILYLLMNWNTIKHQPKREKIIQNIHSFRQTNRLMSQNKFKIETYLQKTNSKINKNKYKLNIQDIDLEIKFNITVNCDINVTKFSFVIPKN
ncbi:hypothetical protein M0813_19216 [Anaeramoeba flamelloides]|uniref:Uncharacterized protein n=1 Tax=Anaeramoeba flamelloides TaxID=1746091 RepID=A0ABQ8YPL9_9EUKA|nr:hypothetical protein M0813_19216 [Anaeramoeba flamelloides]